MDEASEDALEMEGLGWKGTVWLYLEGWLSPYWQVFGLSEWKVYLCTQELVQEVEREDESRERGMKEKKSQHHTDITTSYPANHWPQKNSHAKAELGPVST